MSKWVRWELSDPIEEEFTLRHFAFALAEMSEWGVYLDGNVDYPVTSGDWEGDFEDVVNERAQEDGFTVQWDAVHFRVTLTGPEE